MDPPSLASCETAGGPHTLPPWAGNKTVVDSGLYGAMVHPYVVGPMAMTGIVWYQGEQNVAGPDSVTSYECTFPALVTSWRNALQRPRLFFGFIQLSGFCCAAYNTCDRKYGLKDGGQPGPIWAGLRQAQMSAASLPMVGWASVLFSLSLNSFLFGPFLRGKTYAVELISRPSITVSEARPTRLS